MSKCDLRIEFDRKDRTYHGGETVTGKVHIRVNETVRSSGVNLTHQWRTHGRGNTTSGPKEKVQLAAECTYSPGEEIAVPFSVTAANHPVTYHGNLINVDHYISVDVNVPWAFNPKAQEEYVLNPGKPPAGFVGTRNAVITLATNTGSSSLIGKVILGVVVCIFVAVLATFALFLLPIILIVAGFFWFRRRALVSRLGEVQLSIPHVVVAPGEPWTVRIQFTPRKQFRINSIGLTLLAKESATSGSGTNSTTHNHTILEQKLVVRANDMLAANELVAEEFSLEFPRTGAYSIELPDNKIKWTAAVRIDIPSFPDWTKTQPIQVVPETFLSNISEAPALDSAESNSSNFSSVTSKSPAAVSPPPDVAPRLFDEGTDDEASEGWDPEVSPGLAQLAAAISAAPRHGSKRGDLVANEAGQVFDANIVIDRVTSLMGSMASDPRYAYGKSVTGTIEGTDQAIQITSPESQNDEIDDLRRGDVWQTQIAIIDFDSLYNRINARQVDDNA